MHGAKAVSHWTSEDVEKWICQAGFQSFWHLLSPHDVTGSDLLTLTNDDWKELMCRSADAKLSVVQLRRLLCQIDGLKPVLPERVPNGSAKKSIHNIDYDNDGSGGRSLTPSVDEEDEANKSVANNSITKCPFCLRPRAMERRPLLPERWKAVLAALYVVLVSWITAFVMVVVHDRVPDMETYPPLPDILLDNIPHIPWAFEMCEFTGMVLLLLWLVVLLFHRHRFILLRRFLSISGTIFLLRCVTMLITSLSVPGKHLDCAPRPYGDLWNKLYNAFVIWTGAGLTLQGVRTCGDYMYSGHTVMLTLLNFFITEYTSRKLYMLHTFTWICNVFGVFFILAAHEHYSIDVFVAFYISSRLFLYYHTLANQQQPTAGVNPDGLPSLDNLSDEAQSTWFWFPLFSFFESGVQGGKIPNEFDWPLDFDHFRTVLAKLTTAEACELKTAVGSGDNGKAGDRKKVADKAQNSRKKFMRK